MSMSAVELDSWAGHGTKDAKIFELSKALKKRCCKKLSSTVHMPGSTRLQGTQP